jgi:hypothetical protein
MDIYSYKLALESLVKPGPDQTLVNVNQAWEYFKESLGVMIEDENYEELGFSIGAAYYYEDKTLRINEDQFEVYLGRLIDAVSGISWRTAEINFYYFYKMNPELRSKLKEVQNPEIEVAYNITNEKEDVFKNTDTFVSLVESNQAVLEIIRDLIPIKASYSFWLT